MIPHFSDSSRGSVLMIRPVVIFVTAALLAVVNLHAEDNTKPRSRKSPTLILQSANSNENSFINGEFVSVLSGNVVFIYDDITIRSDEATWWRNEGRINFSDNIRITQKSQILTCNKMHFTRQTNRIDAFGRFRYRDTVERVELTGETASYRIDTKYFTLEGKPRLVRFDTASAETLIIKGKKMIYNDSLKQAAVIDSVIITKGKLTSRCERAVYFTERNEAALRKQPRIVYDIHELAGDSIDLRFGKESLRSASVYPNAHGLYLDISGNDADTAFTNVWGDSLYMSVTDSGYLDSLWVNGKALSKYYVTSSSDMVNQASGKVMLMSFGRDGNVEKVKIWGNARSTYFIEEKDSRGVNEASGDSITVEFKKGKAVFLNLAGSARGIFFPSDL